MKLYLRLLQYAKPYTMRIGVAFICLAMTAGLTALGMYLIKPVLDQVFSKRTESS